MSTVALVVEDDPRIVEEIEDILDSIGHQHVWASNLQDARAALASEDFAYVLLDLEIPTKPNRGFASKENGPILLEEIQRLKGYRQLPVIVMTGYWDYCVNRGADYLQKGAFKFITKPFPTESHTLPSVIRKVLKDHRREKRIAKSGGAEPFSGGDLAFFDDRIELLGVKIISDRGNGLTMSILGELRRRDTNGRFICLSADELVQAVAASCITTITGCIRLARRNIVSRLRRQLNIDVPLDGVIARDEQGYYLRDWITVVGDDGAELSGMATSEPTCPHDLNERQQWVLTELRRGTMVDRAMLERRFGVADRTAKRDLASLSRRGLITFVRGGRGGSYRLR